MYRAGAELKFSSRSTQVQFRPAEAPLCFHFATLDLNFIVVACITISESNFIASPPVTRATSRSSPRSRPRTRARFPFICYFGVGFLCRPCRMHLLVLGLSPALRRKAARITLHSRSLRGYFGKARYPKNSMVLWN